MLFVYLTEEGVRMTTAARIWNQQDAPGEIASGRRLRRYEQILGQIATGVFILEPRIAQDPDSLEVTFVNEMGARFFGRIGDTGSQVLRDAGH